MLPLIRVVAGLFERDDDVLIARRVHPPEWAGWWEFPGGKVEPHETDAMALVRELEEELGVRVDVGAAVVTAMHTDAARRVAISVYRIRSFTGIPVPREHSALAWVSLQALPTYKLLPADLVVLQALQDLRD